MGGIGGTPPDTELSKGSGPACFSYYISARSLSPALDTVGR